MQQLPQWVKEAIASYDYDEELEQAEEGTTLEPQELERFLLTLERSK